MTIIDTAPGQVPVSLHTTDEVVASTLPVDLATDTWQTLMRLVIPEVLPGDVLDITARARVTNDVGYTVGVGYHLWLYDVDNGPWPHDPWVRIGPSNGDNVTHDRHHLPVDITGVYQIPAGWPAGHRPVVVLRADAHSTAWQAGDTLTVDPLGVLTVRRWSAGGS